MGLTSLSLLVVVMLTVLAPAAAAVARPKTLMSFKSPALGAVVVGGQLAAVLVVALAANDSFGFYPSWSDLVGQKVTFAAPPLLANLTLDSSALKALAVAPKGRGAQIQVVFTGDKPGTFRALAYVPAAYRGTNRLLRFPVLQVIGAPTSGASERGFFGRLDSEISSGRMPPLVALAVQTASASLRPSLLSLGLRAQLETQLRVRSDQAAWGLLGIGNAVRVARQLARSEPAVYGPVAEAPDNEQLMRALDEIGRELSPPLAPPLTGGGTVTSRRADLRG